MLGNAMLSDKEAVEVHEELFLRFHHIGVIS